MKQMAREEIVALIKTARSKGLRAKDDLEKLKREISKKSGAAETVRNSVIVKTYKELVAQGDVTRDREFERLIKNKEIRTSSGVAPVAILTKPYPCPGKCTFCPTQWRMPKSYLSNEPAVMRAINNQFDPYLQVTNRIEQYVTIGHSTDKIELIILGGTFSAYPRSYRQEFIQGCYDAANGRKASGLAEAQQINESADNKMVCLSVESRPDAVTESEIKFLRTLGVTKIQMGVQTIFDDILEYVKRGHGVDQVIKATQLLKDAGFKICYHMMPNLPQSTPTRDLQSFKEIFTNPYFQPDTLKIYPCVILKEAELYRDWVKGKYLPYSDEVLANLIVEVKKIIPEYIRIDRVYRDIPRESIIAGCTSSNLREVLKTRMLEQNVECKCIRCREIKTQDFQGDVRLRIKKYEASKGLEYFLSFTDKNGKLYALLRLRIPSHVIESKRHFIEQLQDAAIIREMHTFGVSLRVGKYPSVETQHRGLGAQLLVRAEEIVRSLGINKLAVIAGVGVRNYFKKFGYDLEGTYMVKSL